MVQDSSMKTRRTAIDAILILRPLAAPPRHVRTIAFASHQAFFEAELLGMDELPYRTVIDLAQLMAVLIATPNCLAAWLRNIPPLIAPTTRFQRASEYGAPIHAGLLPATMVN
jgi:hypothetical protein